MDNINKDFAINLYKSWIKNCKDENLSEELEKIAENQQEIYERFYKSLNFGTAGLRGVMGAGTNRMNIYTVAAATQGYANCIKKLYKNSSVAIAYDSRNNSKNFAEITASVFAANNITVYLFDELMPTPLLSYAIRSLKCVGGVVITASHNPKEYNGYKAYDENGCQINEKVAEDVFNEINKVDIFSGVAKMDFEKAIELGKIKMIGKNLSDDFIMKTYEFIQNKCICKSSKVKIAFTPLNGAGLKPITQILKKIGVENLYIVESQKNPDGNFPTCPYPNPEIDKALEEGLKLAKQVNADILIASDPDSDRLGCAVLHKGEFKILTGNELGILMSYYICNSKIKCNNMPQNPVIVKSVVSSPLTDIIAKDFGVRVKSVLTGFKNIGGYMEKLDENNELSSFIFGFEESCGYLPTTLVRDKDAVSAAAITAEMTACFKEKGQTLIDVLNEIYKKYGYYISKSKSYEFKGFNGESTMKELMSDLRNNIPENIGTLKVVKFKDYEKESELKTNMLEFVLENSAQILVRPSGTEPKIKFYFNIFADTEIERDKRFQEAQNCVESLIKKYC